MLPNDENFFWWKGWKNLKKTLQQLTPTTSQIHLE